ncbi:MAG: hypothetical protein NT166_21355 [Candidatus Aminicenantes bacterium]|nr:hypothetical protein [Candidatus Aminicenantes bacterium]
MKDVTDDSPKKHNLVGNRQCLFPTDAAVVFTREEKEQILDEYNEIISELGALNGFSLEWLCHPISEKNDLAPDTLLDRLIDFLTFQCVVSKAGKRAPALARWIKKAVRLFKGAIQQQYWFMKSRFLWKRLDENKTYTVIRTWFDGRSRALMKDNKDIYFGRLPGFLKKNGLHVLYFGEFAYDFEHEFANITKGLEDPVILGRSLLHGWDFVKGFRFQHTASRRIKLQPGLKILGVDVDAVFRNYFQEHCQDQEIRANYLSYRAVVKLAKKIKIDHFYMPFENYAWEKLTHLALLSKVLGGVGTLFQKGSDPPEAKVISFQHAQVALNAAKFFMGEKERNSVVFPDRIVTVGEVTRRFLIERKHYPVERVVAGCALRQDYVFSGERVERKQTLRVLAQLWSVGKSARLINFLHAAGIHPGKFHVTISPHPCNPLEKFIPHLDFEYRDHFTLFTGSLKESFSVNDLVIYHGTTACLDALANGLPVINVEFDDFITVDPLFDFHDFKWTVSKPEELAGAIDTIYALRDEEYYERQQKGFEFVKNYFYPVNDENMRKFL